MFEGPSPIYKPYAILRRLVMYTNSANVSNVVSCKYTRDGNGSVGHGLSVKLVTIFDRSHGSWITASEMFRLKIIKNC